MMVVSPLCSMFIFCAKAEVVADAINMRQAAFIILFVLIVLLLLIVIVYIYNVLLFVLLPTALYIILYIEAVDDVY